MGRSTIWKKVSKDLASYNKHMKHKLFIFIIWALPLLGSAQQWVVDLNDHEDSSYIVNGVSNDDGDVMAVGHFVNSDKTYYPLIIKIHDDGSYEKQDCSNFNDLGLLSVIKLQNGNYFTAGVSSDKLKIGVIVFNDNLDIISAKVYDTDSIVTSSVNGQLNREAQLLLDDDGTVVLCGAYRYKEDTYSTPFRPYFYRFDEMGDTLDYRYAHPQNNEPEYYLTPFSCQKIMRSPVSDGYLLICQGGRSGSCSSFAYYDKDFNYVDNHTLMNPNINYWPMFDECYSDYMLSDDRMLVFGCNGHKSIKYDENDLLLADASVDGTVNSFVNIYHTADTSHLVNGHCMAVVNDTTIYGSFYSYIAFKNSSLQPEVWPGVCLFNKNMELLGLISLPWEQYYWWGVSTILPTDDGGCLMIGGCYTSFGGSRYFGVMFKLLREDFNPILCSVSEVPKERLKAMAFPNPTKGELNIDISNLPKNLENRVSITDVSGMTRMCRIIQGSGNLLTIDVSSLEPGAYLYSVYNKEKEVFNGKFVKN